MENNCQVAKTENMHIWTMKISCNDFLFGKELVLFMAFQLTLRPGGPSSPGDPGSPGSPVEILKQNLFTLKLYLYIHMCLWAWVF